MTIYPCHEYIPYTYLIGWSRLDKWYYGVEYSIKCKIANPSNLWSIYFTSSNAVKTFRRKHGEPDVIQIRKTFKTAKEAQYWEDKVIMRIGAVSKSNWLNRGRFGSKLFDMSGFVTVKSIFDGTISKITCEEFHSIENVEFVHHLKGVKNEGASKRIKSMPELAVLGGKARKGKVRVISIEGNKTYIFPDDPLFGSFYIPYSEPLSTSPRTCDICGHQTNTHSILKHYRRHHPEDEFNPQKNRAK